MKVRIVKALMNTYWYSERIGEEFEVEEYDRRLYKVVNTSWFLDKDDVKVIEEFNKQETEGGSKLNVNDAVLLLQGLLDYGYDPSTEIILKHDSVRVNAFGKTFLVSNEDSLEDICKAVVKLSGAELS